MGEGRGEEEVEKLPVNPPSNRLCLAVAAQTETSKTSFPLEASKQAVSERKIFLGKEKNDFSR